MPSKNVRNIGNPKKRKHGKYAIDVHREKDYHSMAANFLLLYFRSTDDFRDCAFIDTVFIRYVNLLFTFLHAITNFFRLVWRQTHNVS